MDCFFGLVNELRLHRWRAAVNWNACSSGLTMRGNLLMIIKVVGGFGRPVRTLASPAARRANLRLLPLRSMVGQLPLEQHIGVRIPEGQPITQKLTLPSSTSLDVSLRTSTVLTKLNQLFTDDKHLQLRSISVPPLRTGHLPTGALRHVLLRVMSKSTWKSDHVLFGVQKSTWLRRGER